MIYIIRTKEICDELQSLSSKKDKETLLIREKENETFKRVLHFLLNPFIVTGISKKKINKQVNVDTQRLYVSDIFDYVTKNNTGRDIDIKVIQQFISNQPCEIQEFYKDLITKSLKLGVDAKTVNKIYGADFIPTFEVMLGTSIKNCSIPNGAWFSISHKLNGSRCTYYKGKLYTRAGREYTGLGHILNDIKTLYGDEDIVLDGELVYKNEEGLTDSEAFQKGVGIANSKATDKTQLKYVVFDVITTEDFEKKISQKTYKERLVDLNVLKSMLVSYKIKNISIVDMFYQGIDQNEIWKWLAYAEEHDLEGIMVNLDAPYQCKRTKDLIKVKEFYSVDLPIVGFEEGQGRNAERVGAILVKYKGSIIGVGSGLSDEQRIYMWGHQSEYINKIVEVSYKEITRDKRTGMESLQFPTFICIRDDKTEVSYD